MKEKIFTLMFALIAGISFSAYAQDASPGVPWGTNNLGGGSPLVFIDDFSGFPMYHSDENSGQGNSDNIFDGEKVIYGYMDTIVEAAIPGSSRKITYTFHQCAFAPEWPVSAVPENGATQTFNVSNGFVEISRFDTIYSDIPTAEGYIIVDLRQLEFVEGIQWTHSSTGGNKRGVLLEISNDDGATWDTLRYQPANNLWGYSFTKDFLSGEKTSNVYNCQLSANGMTWEDLIYASNVMLRFIDAGMPEGTTGGTVQTARIHDLRVYGDLPTSSNIVKKNELNIYSVYKTIHISEQAKVAVYNLSGALVKQVNYSREVPMNDMPNGIYLVKAQTNTSVQTSKVIIK